MMSDRDDAGTDSTCFGAAAAAAWRDSPGARPSQGLAAAAIAVCQSRLLRMAPALPPPPPQPCCTCCKPGAVHLAASLRKE